MVVLGKIAAAIIAISIFVIVAVGMFSDFGSFSKLKGTVSNTVTDWTPNLTQEANTADVSIPESHRNAILKLNETIHKMVKSNKKDCVDNFGGFPDLGEDETSISVVGNLQTNIMQIRVTGGAGGKQIISDLAIDIPGAKLCVIGGEEIITEGFEKKAKGESSNTYWTPTASVKIKQDDGGYTGITENRINYGKGFMDFEGNAWLFPPGDGFICFFPTVDGDSDDDGVNDDVVHALPNKLSTC